jgi:hypothetical protein
MSPYTSMSETHIFPIADLLWGRGSPGDGE